jgi:hypothetical protein
MTCQGIAEHGALDSGRPSDAPAFHWARSGEYVTQVTAIGPLALEYVKPRDDPRELHGHRDLRS